MSHTPERTSEDEEARLRLASLTSTAAHDVAKSRSESHSETRGLPPVERWNPPFCGNIDMVIAADGSWHYMGSPIARPAMVRLFSTILRKDPEGYMLVTPVERVGITVEDAPFVAAAMRIADNRTGPALTFVTTVGDETTAGPEHALRFETGLHDGCKPYVHVRADLWAKLSRPIAYDLLARGETREVDGAVWFGVASGGVFFPAMPADAESADPA